MAPLSLGRARNNGRKAGISGTAWFCSAVRPDAPRGLGSYAAAPPRGMTNPPQNPAVRAALLKELIDYGISLEAPGQWPPPPPLPSSPADSATASTAEPLPRLFVPVSTSAPQRFRGGLARGQRSLANAGTQSLPQLECSSSATPGCSSGPARHRAASLQRHPSDCQAVNFGPASAEANGRHRKRGGSVEALPPLSQSPLQLEAAARHACASSPEILRGKPESDLLSHCDTGRDSAAASGSGASKSSPAKHEKAFQHGKSKRSLSELEMCTAIDALRSKGRSHRVSLDDRFRQSADPEGGGTVVMQGAQWRSDGATLVSHHNNAMRHLNPSRLDKRPPEPKKKKRQSYIEDQEDPGSPEHYTKDAALAALRDLRLKHFPDTEKAELLQAQIAEQEKHKKIVVEDLKANLGLNFMEKFSIPEELH